MSDAASEKKPEKKPEKKHKVTRIWRTRAGDPVNYKGAKKFFLDVIAYHNGVRAWEKTELVEVDDANSPLLGRPLTPGRNSPVCAACGLDQQGARHPYLEYVGSENPIATIIVDSVSRSEDDRNELGAGKGPVAQLAALVYKLQQQHGVDLDDIRWVPLTRCAYREGKPPNYKTKGNWCRHHVIHDLMLHPPKVVIPVGTSVLGLFSHKSNAQDWSGRLLTWRGWPDDWLTEPKYMLDRPDPAKDGSTVRGHPLFGPPPNVRIPMVPLQSRNLILAYQNPVLAKEWENHLVEALRTGREGVPPPSYVRPWYHISTDLREIVDILRRVIAYAKQYRPFVISYDTETTGLKAWAHFRRVKVSASGLTPDEKPPPDEVVRSPDPKIVFMMFRWRNPETGEPESLGFPWDYDGSELRPVLDDLTPIVIELLATADVAGHNLTFDELFTLATIGRRADDHKPILADGSFNPDWLDLQDRINRLADAGGWDTWHMAFTLLQRRGSLGLEVLAYDWVPDLAGYEEEMTLLIDLHGDSMNPANGKGGHYANCPKPLWDSHLKPYVMGDVEVTYRSRDALETRLRETKTYEIPLARPGMPGRFRYFAVPNRHWVYRNIVSPASKTLTKMMARGMHIDPEELGRQEETFPDKIDKAKQKLRDVDEIIERWCQTKSQEANTPKEGQEKGSMWELDLENKGQLKELLFGILQCPVHRFTKAGRKIYGDDVAGWQHLTREECVKYAAVDKFTLNKLAVDHPNLRPLQEYRKVFKLYSTYVRPLRNMMVEHLDKKQRTKEPHLSVDQCIHASFMLTGTRGGRLSCRDPNLQQLPNDGVVKRLFSSRFGDLGCIYAADLSQIELRLMAAVCGDKSMVDAYLRDIDLHSLTASKIRWRDGTHSYEEFTKKHMEELQKQGKTERAKKLELKRKVAKTVNFLTGYGGGAFGLQNVLANNEVYLSLEECEDIIESFFEAYPALKKFLGVYKNFIEEHARAVSIFGRVRHFEEIWSDDNESRSKALRAGCNHLIQSTASDMMLLCLTVIERLMRDAGLPSILVSTVHDSLVVDCLRQDLPEVHNIAFSVMNNIPVVLEAMLPDFDRSWMIVPFAGDSEVGRNYYDMRKVAGTGDNDWDRLLDADDAKKSTSLSA